MSFVEIGPLGDVVAVSPNGGVFLYSKKSNESDGSWQSLTTQSDDPKIDKVYISRSSDV